MIVVIQCAARKHPDAGYLRRHDGKRIMFVADPESAPGSATCAYARPDDMAADGSAWRTKLLDYNAAPGDNPLGLFPAWQLYENPIYGLLAEHCGLDKLYILSAGWGLIESPFLTPVYDITFSANAELYKRRKQSDEYLDWSMLPIQTTEPIVFFGGKSYVDLFSALTRQVAGPRHVFYSSAHAPAASGCTLQRFNTTTRTNWHYECAKAFIAGKLSLAPG